MKFNRSTIAGIASAVLGGWRNPRFTPKCPIDSTPTKKLDGKDAYQCEKGHVFGPDAPRDESARNMNAGDHHGEL